MAAPVSQTAVIAAVDAPGVGKAAGANNVFQELGGAFGVAMAVAVFVTAAGGAGGDGTDGFGPAIGMAAAFAFIGLVAVGVLPHSAETMITVRSVESARQPGS